MFTDKSSSLRSKRQIILETYAAWTALSALRSNSPIRSRDDVYGAIRAIGLREASILDVELGPIEQDEFEQWHADTLARIMKYDARLKGQFGWSAKIINVYLKTLAYVGDGGRLRLREWLHPPIDAGLWKGVKKWFSGIRERPDIIADTHHKTKIKDINSHDDYLRIIKGLRVAAAAEECWLIEIEFLWQFPLKDVRNQLG